MVTQTGIRNMSLPLAMSTPVGVDENTPNLEEVQSFPVVGIADDGTHFHQDTVTGQMYKMSEDFHNRIPGILASRMTSTIIPTMTTTVPESFTSDEYLNAIIQLSNETPSQTVLTDILRQVNTDNVMNFTEVVTEINQKEFIPPTTQDYSGQSYKTGYTAPTMYTDYSMGNITYVNDLVNGVSSKINVFRNTVNTADMGPFQQPVFSPVNKFIKEAGNRLEISSTTIYIPINKFYNTLSA